MPCKLNTDVLARGAPINTELPFSELVCKATEYPKWEYDWSPWNVRAVRRSRLNGNTPSVTRISSMPAICWDMPDLVGMIRIVRRRCCCCCVGVDCRHWVYRECTSRTDPESVEMHVAASVTCYNVTNEYPVKKVYTILTQSFTWIILFCHKLW